MVCKCKVKGQELVNNVCECPHKGQIEIDGECSCPEGKKLDEVDGMKRCVDIGKSNSVITVVVLLTHYKKSHIP